jgi:hypothetical protein
MTSAAWPLATCPREDLPTIKCPAPMNKVGSPRHWGISFPQKILS